MPVESDGLSAEISSYSSTPAEPTVLDLSTDRYIAYDKIWKDSLSLIFLFLYGLFTDFSVAQICSVEW